MYGFIIYVVDDGTEYTVSKNFLSNCKVFFSVFLTFFEQ